MFVYSERPGTLAAKRYEDNVDMDTKKRRLNEIVAMQNNLSYESNKKDVGKFFEVLIEGNSKRSDLQWMGRNSQNKVMIFNKTPALTLKKGDYVNVVVNEFTQATLFCTIVH
jgi:tRNA-2-methylthio-N6-dimethylallyladenosine synthase